MSVTVVDCEVHGAANRAFVCAHLVETLHDERPRGAFWSRDDDGCINAYCARCAEALEGAGGEWTDRVVEGLGVQIVCESCFRRVASLNGFRELD